MRRLAGTTDLLLLATVAVWALNVSVTKYVLTHGFEPLAYASIRYALAALLAALFVLVINYAGGARAPRLAPGLDCGALPVREPDLLRLLAEARRARRRCR